MKKQYSKILCYIILAALFVVLLVSFNSIILLGVDNSQKFISSNQIFSSNSRVYFNIDKLETYNDLYESIYISGWAFCEAEDSDGNKTYDIVLQNEKNAYVVHTAAATREDIRWNFPARKIPTIYNGIEVQASTLGIKDGVYDLYLYVRENEENYGLVNVGRQIIKSKDRFEELEYALVTQEFSAQISGLVKRHSETEAVSENGSLKISGWCFVEGRNAYEQKVYIMTKADEGQLAYTAKKSTRMDVSSHFNNDDYYFSGFSVEIPDGKDIYAYSICIETNGEILCTEWINIDE